MNWLLLLSLTFLQVQVQAVPLNIFGFNQKASVSMGNSSTTHVYGEIAQPTWTQDDIEDKLADISDPFSGENSFRFPHPNITLPEISFPKVNWTEVADWKVSDDEKPPAKIDRQYHGIFDRMCDAAVQRFWKLGKCIEKTDEFKHLNASFWYQAAKQELCGYDMQLEPNTESPTWNSTFNFTNSFAGFLDHFRNFSIIPSYNFSFFGHNFTHIKGRTAVPPRVIAKQKAIIKAKEESINGELQAEYLYLIRQAYKNATNIGPSQIAEIQAKHNLEELDKRGLASLIGTIAGAPVTPEALCMGLCDQLRKGSNAVDLCWEVTGLSVLYGVCSVGCLYYF